MNIPADDATLAARLESANLPSLLPAIVQLTGDMSLLERFPPPTTPMMGAVDGDLSEEDQASAARRCARRSSRKVLAPSGSCDPQTCPTHSNRADGEI